MTNRTNFSQSECDKFTIGEVPYLGDVADFYLEMVSIYYLPWVDLKLKKMGPDLFINIPMFFTICKILLSLFSEFYNSTFHSSNNPHTHTVPTI